MVKPVGRAAAASLERRDAGNREGFGEDMLRGVVSGDEREAARYLLV